MREAYVGVTGIKTKEERDYVQEVFRSEGLVNKAGLTGMIGYVIYDWQFGMPDDNHSQGPSLRELSELLEDRPLDLLPMIHYCTSDNSRVGIDVPSLLDIAPHIALQVNTLWPHAHVLRDIKSPLVLQLPEQSLSVSSLRDMVRQYDGSVDYVLIDPSMGRGVSFDPETVSRQLRDVGAGVDATLGVAGGLGAENVYDVLCSVRERWDRPLCVDATSRIRKGDYLDLDLTARYIRNAARALRD